MSLLVYPIIDWLAFLRGRPGLRLAGSTTPTRGSVSSGSATGAPSLVAPVSTGRWAFAQEHGAVDEFGFEPVAGCQAKLAAEAGGQGEPS
jgi:hypothetical protein